MCYNCVSLHGRLWILETLLHFLTVAKVKKFSSVITPEHTDTTHRRKHRMKENRIRIYVHRNRNPTITKSSIKEKYHPAAPAPAALHSVYPPGFRNSGKCGILTNTKSLPS